MKRLVFVISLFRKYSVHANKSVTPCINKPPIYHQPRCNQQRPGSPPSTLQHSHHAKLTTTNPALSANNIPRTAIRSPIKTPSHCTTLPQTQLLASLPHNHSPRSLLAILSPGKPSKLRQLLVL